MCEHVFGSGTRDRDYLIKSHIENFFSIEKEELEIATGEINYFVDTESPKQDSNLEWLHVSGTIEKIKLSENYYSGTFDTKVLIKRDDPIVILDQTEKVTIDLNDSLPESLVSNLAKEHIKKNYPEAKEIEIVKNRRREKDGNVEDFLSVLLNNHTAIFFWNLSKEEAYLYNVSELIEIKRKSWTDERFEELFSCEIPAVEPYISKVEELVLPRVQEEYFKAGGIRPVREKSSKIKKIENVALLEATIGRVLIQWTFEYHLAFQFQIERYSCTANLIIGFEQGKAELLDFEMTSILLK